VSLLSIPFFFYFSFLFRLADYTHAQMNTERVHTEKNTPLDRIRLGWPATSQPRRTGTDGPVFGARFAMGPKGKWIKGQDEKGKKKKKQRLFILFAHGC
jgi:hypothetical protein